MTSYEKSGEIRDAIREDTEMFCNMLIAISAGDHVDDQITRTRSNGEQVTKSRLEILSSRISPKEFIRLGNDFHCHFTEEDHILLGVFDGYRIKEQEPQIGIDLKTWKRMLKRYSVMDVSDYMSNLDKKTYFRQDKDTGIVSTFTVYRRHHCSLFCCAFDFCDCGYYVPDEFEDNEEDGTFPRVISIEEIMELELYNFLPLYISKFGAKCVIDCVR